MNKNIKVGDKVRVGPQGYIWWNYSAFTWHEIMEVYSYGLMVNINGKNLFFSHDSILEVKKGQDNE